MEELTVSVVIPVYNRASLVGRAIRSALAAISDGDEIIVVDDASTDQTPERIREFGDRIRYIRVSHGGAGKARNAGIAASRCSLVAFLDSDDEWMSDKLFLQRQVMKHWPQVVFCFSDFGTRMPDGAEQAKALCTWTHDARPCDKVMGKGDLFSTVGELPPGRTDFAVHRGSIYRAMLDAPYVSTDTVVARRSLAGDVLWFPEDLSFDEDWECFARMSHLGEVAFLDCATSWQWGHAGPRMTDLSLAGRAGCRLSMVQRVWGSDTQFLKQNQSAFDRIVAQQHLLLGRQALSEGRIADARAELARSGTQAQARLYRLLASVPFIFQGLRAVKHCVAG